MINRYLVEGYPIDTGLIEGSFGSLIKDRTDRNGSHRAPKEIQAVLNLMAVMKNGDWDEYFDYYMISEHERPYGNLSSSQLSSLPEAA